MSSSYITLILEVHNLSSCEIKAWKKSGLNRIQTHGLCDTNAVLYQLSYQAIWELVTCGLLSNSQSLIWDKRNFSNIALDFVAPTHTESTS